MDGEFILFRHEDFPLTYSGSIRVCFERGWERFYKFNPNGESDWHLACDTKGGGQSNSPSILLRRWGWWDGVPRIGILESRGSSLLYDDSKCLK